MTPAEGVILIDSSELNFEQTVAAVLETIANATA
jgi:cytidylate kinase